MWPTISGAATCTATTVMGRSPLCSGEARIDEAGAGMSVCWSDFDNDGKQDVYVADMWSSAGQRVSGQKRFHERAPEEIRALYRRHARGNALYRNLGNGGFQQQPASRSRDGPLVLVFGFLGFRSRWLPDLYVANGYISAPERNDLASFFWRQVVAKSPGMLHLRWLTSMDGMPSMN